MNTQFKFVLFWVAVLLYNPSTAVPIPIEQENELLADDNTGGRQIQNILDIPQQVASFIGNALFPTTPTTTARATTEEPTLPTRRSSRTTSTKESVRAAAAPVTPRIKYVYVTPPPPRVVIVKPRPFAPAITQPPATEEAPVVTEAVTEAAEGGDEDEDTEEEGI